MGTMGFDVPAQASGHQQRLEQLRFDPTLSAPRRALLTTDGCLTRMLEAYACEPIAAVKLAHVLIEPRHQGCPLLDMDGDEALLERTILLRGRHSEKNYVFAEAVIAPQRLSPEVADGLAMTDCPIGPLLSEHRVETWRELLQWGEEPAGARAEHLRVPESAALMFRTYRVYSGGQPIMAVTETFAGESTIA